VVATADLVAIDQVPVHVVQLRVALLHVTPAHVHMNEGG